MDVEQAERFVAAAERDYAACVTLYDALVHREHETGEMVDEVAEWEEVRDARADVLAAQQVLMLAREERRIAERRAGEERG